MPVIRQEPIADSTTQWRFDRFEELGFGYDDAMTLANTRSASGFYLYWGNVAKYLDNGATHDQVLDWFTYPGE